MFSDETRFTQIFLNFLSNAFKFTPDHGKIEVMIKPDYIDGGFCQQIPNEEAEQNLKQQVMKTIMSDNNASQLLAAQFMEMPSMGFSHRCLKMLVPVHRPIHQVFQPKPVETGFMRPIE